MALIAKTRPQAALVLADGTVFQGESTGAAGLTVGEVVFNTSMTGYQEILTDPSYTGQLVTLTCAHIGNVGVNPKDMESNAIHAAGLIVKAAADVPSNWRARQSLPEALKDAGVKAICGIDTRALTIHLRTTGAQAGAIIAKQMGDELTDEDLQQALEAARSWGSMAGQDLAKTVTTDHVYDWTDGSWEPSREGEPAGFRRAAVFPYHVVAYDFGIKTNILRLLADRGIRVTVVPAQTPFEEAMKHQPDGIFLSNGPGDPAPCTYAIEVAQKAIAAKLPLFGICLGHQIMGLAVGAKTLKMKFGHHGGNHPVQNLLTGRVEVTAQNHGFCPCFQSLGALVPELSGGATEHVEDLREWGRRGIAPVVANERFGRIRLTHVNLDDGTAEGFAFLDVPAFSVQYHPEAAPGPTDAHYLFTAFARLMEGRDDYLDIDIATDRLSGWKFGADTEGEVA